MKRSSQNNRILGVLLDAWRIAKDVLHTGSGLRRSSAGFTLIEIAFACEVMMLLTLISYNETSRVKEHARVAACMRYQGIMQRSLWADYAFDGVFPLSLVDTLNRLPRGALDKTYDFTPIGGGPAGAEEYYIRCTHNHSYVGVLFIDSGAYITPKPIYALAAARGP